jgi:alcohol dehydrogenase YqhD (iron-dependent ADH family)
MSGHTFPKVSIVNPALMNTVSRDYLVYSAADVIAHSIEGYFTAAVQPRFHSRLVEAIINTVIETTETLLANPDDYNARAEFAWASTQALNGLIYAGTSGYSYPNHMIEHSLSALFNVPHGAGLSVVIPAWMKWYHGRNSVPVRALCQERVWRHHCRAGHCRARKVVRQDRHAHAPVATGYHGRPICPRRSRTCWAMPIISASPTSIPGMWSPTF